MKQRERIWIGEMGREKRGEEVQMEKGKGVKGKSGGRRLFFSIVIRREHTGGLLRVGYLICGIVR